MVAKDLITLVKRCLRQTVSFTRPCRVTEYRGLSVCVLVCVSPAMGVRTWGQMGSADPLENGWKIKKRKHAKKSSFLCLCYILRAIRASRCRERRYAGHIFIQIYFRMHHFVVRFLKFSSPQAARGHWPPNQNPADVPESSPAKTAEPIEMPFGWQYRVGTWGRVWWIGLQCGGAAMRPIATFTVVTCFYMPGLSKHQFSDVAGFTH